MKKWIAKATLWILSLLAILFVGLPYLMSWQLSNSHKYTWKAMNSTDFPCPPNTELTIHGWSKAGYMRYCEPNKNGMWEAWSEGYLHIRGEYIDGKKYGKWTWFNQDGSIQSTTVY